MAKKPSKDIIERAKTDLEASMNVWNPVYSAARADLDFMRDEPGAQWDSKDFAERLRKRRPALTIDQLEQFVNQVSNDIKMNTPSINIAPAGNGADPETAQIFQGLIREAAQRHNADSAYDTGCTGAIEASIGYFRIDHDYAREEGFEQELTFKRVINPFCVFMDANSTERDGSDQMNCTVIEKMTTAEFKKRWSGKRPVSFDAPGLPPCTEDKDLWVCEYFRISESQRFQYQLKDGTIGTLDSEPDPSTMGDVVASRYIRKRTVHRYWLSGNDILEETTFPGRYIPIIPVLGKEKWKDGKRRLQSLIRKSKDAQRMFNYWASTEAELLMKAPKAPVVAAAGSTEAYAEDWINPDKANVLRYDPYDDANRPNPAPLLGNMPQIPAGIVTARRESAEDIKTTMGLYNASLGARSNEVSGKAIQARQMEGDVAVYHFGDNLVNSIRHAGVICVHAAPEIYDTPRIVSIIGKEDTGEVVGINGARVPGQQRDYFLTEGQYSVAVTTGPAFATLRKEAAEFFEQIVMTSPEMMGQIGDLVFKYMDFPGAQAVSDRLRRLIPPQLLGEQEQDPAVAAAEQQVQELTAAVAELQQQVDSKREETLAKERVELAKDETERQKIELEREKAAQETKYRNNELSFKKAELAMKRYELNLRRQELARTTVQAGESHAAD